MSRAGLNPLKDFSTFMALWGLMRRVRPNKVLSYTIKPVIYGTLAAALSGVSQRYAMITGLGYAFTGQATGLRQYVQKVVQLLYKLALARASKVFFQNPDDRALFKHLGLVPAQTPTVVVNGSGVDVASFTVQPLPTSNIHFLLIARLLGDKGIREYAQAARLLKIQYPEVSCSLVGWVDQNPSSIKQEELESWVNSGDLHYLGKLEDVRPAIAACSVYVLPSYREGTPRTVLEAMAMGRAIITTDAPGCRETVVHGDNGFLVLIQSVESLLSAMIRFVENPKLASSMGIRSREIAENKYDVNKVNDVMLFEMRFHTSNK
jgi:glycosyltransferase involved in cell wall biosynthesis